MPTRRDVLKWAGASAAMAGLSACASIGRREEGAGIAAPPADPAARMVLGCQWSSQVPDLDERLRHRARFGVTHICAHPPVDETGRWHPDEVRRFADHVASFGLVLDMLPLPLSSPRYPNIMLGRSPERDEEIRLICDLIRAAGQAGIPSAKYGMSVRMGGTLRTQPTVGRGGARYSTWRLAEAPDPGPPRVGSIPIEVLWERITYFLERVVPVAAEYNVRLACHPEDPGVPESYLGVQQPLGTVEGLKRFVSICENPFHGLNFCQGSIAEMLDDPGAEIYDVIRWFGERGKILNVHFRDIRGRRDDFQEVYHDEGDVDMLRAMRIYKECGYRHMVMPDHAPWHEDDPKMHQGYAFAYGYIRGLMHAVYADEDAAARSA